MDATLRTPFHIRTEGAILHLTLNRPKANAIDLATSRLMGEAFRAFRDDPAGRGREVLLPRLGSEGRRRGRCG